LISPWNDIFLASSPLSPSSVFCSWTLPRWALTLELAGRGVRRAGEIWLIFLLTGHFVGYDTLCAPGNWMCGSWVVLLGEFCGRMYEGSDIRHLSSSSTHRKSLFFC
jgi:hypothetical protein